MEDLRAKLRRAGKTCHMNIHIKACALWDSVKSTHLGYGANIRHVQRNLYSHLDYAFQALALHERRAKFEPELWTRSPGQTLKQCWFLGHHSDVRGSNSNLRPASLSLVWMAKQLNNKMSIDEGRLGVLTFDGVLSSSTQSRPQQLILEDSRKGKRIWAPVLNASRQSTSGEGQHGKHSAIDMTSDTCESMHWSVN